MHPSIVILTFLCCCKMLAHAVAVRCPEVDPAESVIFRLRATSSNIRFQYWFAYFSPSCDHDDSAVTDLECKCPLAGNDYAAAMYVKRKKKKKRHGTGIPNDG